MEFALASRTGGVPRVLDRRISNAGRLHDIRERDPQQIFTTGGIQKFSMLGSHNAISYVPTAYKTSEAGTQTNLPGVPTPTKRDNLPGMTKKDTGTGGDEPVPEPVPERELLRGATQSEASKQQIEERKRDAAVEPSAQPPFNLSDSKDKEDYDAYVEYYNTRYGKDVARPEIDKLKKDSEGFTIAVKAYKVLQDEINKFNRDDAKRWAEWFNNMLVKFGDTIIDGLALGASTVFPENKKIIDNIKDFSKKFTPKTPTDAVAGLKKLQTELFAGKPAWSKKLNVIKKDAFDKLVKELEHEIGGIEDMDEVMTKKPKKKDDLMMSAPKTYPKTKEGVKEYKADNPKASQRAISQALGMPKTTVQRYLK